jgi:hypothetical protein
LASAVFILSFPSATGYHCSVISFILYHTHISQLFPGLANLAHHLFSFTLDGRKEKKRYKIFYVHAMLCISSYVPFTKITGHGSSDQFITSRWLSGFKKEERKRERN